MMQHWQLKVCANECCRLEDGSVAIVGDQWIDDRGWMALLHGRLTAEM